MFTFKGYLLLIFTFLISLVPYLTDTGLGLLRVVDLVLLFIFVYDYRAAPYKEQISITRETPRVFAIGEANEVIIKVQNSSFRTAILFIRDEYPSSMDIQVSHDFTIKIAPKGTGSFTYQLIPENRGDYSFGPIHYRSRGPLGLINRDGKVEAPWELRVYPHIPRAHEAHLLITRGIGQRTYPISIRGGSREFESVKDYVIGDEYKGINWKATARRGRFMSNQYQDQRDQDVLIALDCGRSMQTSLGKLKRIDHAVNSAYLLANGILQKGDNVGLVSFGVETEGLVPLGKGRSYLKNILIGLYNIQAQYLQTDYTELLKIASRRLNRRTLIVVFSEVDTPESAELIVPVFQELGKRHLVVLVALNDPKLKEETKKEIKIPFDIYLRASALDLMQTREKALKLLKKSGCIVVDSSPYDAPIDTLTAYLGLKRKGLI